MKKLIIRKFYKDILIFFLVSLFLTGIIVWTIQAVNYFDFVTEDGHGLKIYFYYSILNFPKIIQRIVPFIFFITIFYILINLELKNETNIFWTHGISKKKILNLTIYFSLIFMFLQIILSGYFSPLSQLKARNYLKNSDINFFTSLIKEGVFINITEGLTIFIDEKDNDGNFKNIFLEEKLKNNSKMIYASNGLLIDNKFQKIFKLFNGQVMDIKNSKINIFNFDEINFSLKNLETKTTTTPKIQEIDTIILLSCFFNIENDKFESFKCNPNFIKEIKVELMNRLYKPIYIPLIVLICCYLLLLSKNHKNYNIKVNIVFFLAFLLLVFSEVSVGYAVISTNFMYIYLFTPFPVFVIGYFLFTRIERNA